MVSRYLQFLSERVLLRVLDDLHVIVESSLDLVDREIHLFRNLFDGIETLHET